MAGRPAKGRYFPIGVASIVAFVREAKLCTRDGTALPVTLLNPKPSQVRDGIVAELRPFWGLRLFSFADEVPAAEGAALWQSILSSIADLSVRKIPVHSGQGPVFTFLGGVRPEPLRVVARWYHYQTRKYRGTDKFTGGLNRKLIKVDELPIVVATDSRER